MILLENMKQFFDIISEKGELSEECLDNVLQELNHSKLRKEMIKLLYSIILSTETHPDFKYARKWITSKLSIEGVANYFNVKQKDVEDELKYITYKYENDFMIKDKSIIYICLFDEDINVEELESILEVSKLKYEDDIVQVNRNFNNKDCLITIPKYKVCKEVSTETFTRLVKLIEPYMVSIKNKNQEQVNEMREAVGYFNYIMSDSDELTEIDIERRKIIRQIVQGESAYSQSEIDKVTFDDLTEIEQKQLATTGKSRKIQYDF